MAGSGKQSPRQKMVGMMYIVLTALLAMNVSSSILEKFATISSSLEKSNVSKSLDSDRILKQMQIMVKELGNRKDDLIIFDNAKKVSEKSKEVIKYIDSLKDTLIKKVGGIDKKTGYPKNLKDDSVVATLMLRENKAKELQKVLNAYVKYVRDLTGDKTIPEIALDAKDIPLFRNDPNQKNKSFGDLNFDKTPLGAAVAMLNVFSAEVVSLADKTIHYFAKKIGEDDVKFDKLSIVVKPNSMYVASGAKYEAEMFLTASSSAVNPNMYVNSKEIKVSDGIGKISFPVFGKNYDKNGISKQSFDAEIKLGSGDKENIVKIKSDYFVVKPVVQVQSASVQALYFNCGNELNIQVPALGVSYNPKFVVKGGVGITSDKIGHITVIPKEKIVKLEIYNGSDLIDILEYRVRALPKPDVKILTGNGTPINEVDGMKVNDLRMLKVKIIPDEGFSSFLPKDANYKVIEWDISLVRGNEKKAHIVVKNSDSQSLYSLLGSSSPSDRLIIEVKKVVRTNFQGIDDLVLFPSPIIKVIQLK